MTTAKLKPCPFCGSDEIEIEKVTRLAYRVFCDKCSASSGLSSEETAIEHWNRRVENES